MRRRAGTKPLFEALQCCRMRTPAAVLLIRSIGRPTVAAERSGAAGRRGLRLPGKGGLGYVVLGTRGWRPVAGA